MSGHCSRVRSPPSIHNVSSGGSPTARSGRCKSAAARERESDASAGRRPQIGNSDPPSSSPIVGSTPASLAIARQNVARREVTSAKSRGAAIAGQTGDRQREQVEIQGVAVVVRREFRVAAIRIDLAMGFLQ